MEEAIENKIQEVMTGMDCPKDFTCYKSGFQNLCKARDVDLEDYLGCLELSPSRCTFSMPFGYSYLCKGPLRVFIAKVFWI